MGLRYSYLLWAVVAALPALAQNPFKCTVQAAVPPLLRAEGKAELVGDIVLNCTGGPAGSLGTANVTVFLGGVPFTSRILDAATKTTEAVLLIDDPSPAPVLNVNMYQGVQVGGNAIAFLGVPIVAPGPSGGSRVFRITNLRAEASAVAPLSFESAQLLSFVSISGSTSVPLNNPQQIVGFIQPGLAEATLRTAADSAATVFNYQRCHGQNAALAANPASGGGAVSFNVKFTEGFATSFKKAMEGTQQNTPGAVYNTESGYAPSGFPGVGNASYGTRLAAKFENVPPGVTLYATTSPSPVGTTSSLLNGAVLTATDGYGAGPLTPVTPTAQITVNSTVLGIAQIPVSGGYGSAVWEITNPSPLAVESASFGILAVYADNAASLGAARVRLGFVPHDAAFETGTSIPRFLDTSTFSPSAAFTVEACTTCNSLITPYVIQEASPVGTAGADVAVTADLGCPWTAVSSVPEWLNVVQGATGSGSGTVRYTMAANNTAVWRGGDLSIAGQTFSVTQRPPTLELHNQASWTQGALAPGEVVAIFGSGFGGLPSGASATPTPGTPLPTTLAQTRILFDGTPAPLLSVASNIATAVVPYGVAGRGTTLIEAEYQGIKQDFVQLPVTPTAPGLFWTSSTGQAYAYNGDGTLNETTPARPGSVISVYLNGAGQTSPAGIDGQVYSGSDTRPVPVQPIQAVLNGFVSPVVSAVVAAANTSAPLGVGVVEVKVVVPPGLSGKVGIILNSGGVSTQAGPTINIGGTACTYSLNPTSRPATAAGGANTVDVVTQPGCHWTAASNVNWITLTTPSSGTGNGTVGFNVAANNSNAVRPGTLTIAGQTATVTQDAAAPVACAPGPSPVVWFDVVDYISSPNPFSDRVLVGRMPMDKYLSLAVVPLPSAANQRLCTPLPIAPGYVADAYLPTAAERSGDFSAFSGLLLDPLTAPSMVLFPAGIIPASRLPNTMAWRIASVTSCTLSVALGGDSSPAPAVLSNRVMSVTANNATCGWAATSNAAWVTFPSGNTGLGSRTVDIRVAPNTSGSSRTATITVAGQSFTVTQTSAQLARPALYRNGVWYLDTNGDGAAERIFGWGGAGAIPITGDWNGDGKTEVGVYMNGVWYLDYNGNGAFDPGIDKVFAWGWSDSKPVVGDWNGDGKDKIGVYRNGVWYLDYNGNGAFDPGTDRIFGWGWADSAPVVGDWNGDGRKKIGVFHQGVWYLDYNGNCAFDGGIDKIFGWGRAGTTPVVGDWNGDGRSKVGVFDQGLWSLDVNGNGSFEAGDKIFGWGSATSTPIVGDWGGDGKTEVGAVQNFLWYLDVDGNGFWSAGDVVYGLGQAGDKVFMGRW